jgi:hypothetical protein
MMVPYSLDKAAVTQWLEQEPLRPGAGSSVQALNKRIGLLAGHMSQQQGEHEKACSNTNLVFNQLLDELPVVCEAFRESFALRGLSTERVYAQVDPDRSVGILNVLWHTITFTTRGNNMPLALHKPGRQPQFTGRLIALHGDFHLMQGQDPMQQPTSFQDWLQYEVCSLFVPADAMEPATLTIRHLNNQTHYFHQLDAARLFLSKTLDMVCGGGFIHESGS